MRSLPRSLGAVDLAALDLLALPIWIHDPVRSALVWANTAAVAFWGAASLDALLAREDPLITTGVNASRMADVMEAIARGERVTHRWTLRPRGRPPVTVDCCFSDVRWAGLDHQVLLVEGHAVDDQVSEAERRSVEALRHTSAMVTLVGADGTVLTRNQAALDAFGERPPHDIFPASVLKRLHASGDAGRSLDIEATVQTERGPQTHRIQANPTSDPASGRSAWVVSQVDVSDRVATEEQLHAASLVAESHRRRALRATRSRTTFVGMVSHELRSPMTAVLGMAELLRGTRLSEVQRSWLDLLEHAGHDLLRLVEDLLDISRIETGQLALHRREFTLGELLSQVDSQTRRLANEAGLDLRFDTPPATPLVGDDARIQQIVQNLVENAVRFTPRGWVAVHTSLSDGVEPPELVIRVADTGIGIAADHRQRLLQSFEQGEGDLARARGGAGLGLAIVNGLCQQLGGTLTVEDNPGGGTVFTARLQVDRGDVHERPAERVDQEAIARRLGPRTVLLADDLPAARVIVRCMLERIGWAVVEVEDGLDALEAVREESFDVVLMDLRMPRMDGITATRRLRESQPSLPVVALTADPQAAHEAGPLFDAVLVKPIDFTLLFGVLATTLGGDLTA